MGELLIQLHREIEAGTRALDPGASDLGPRLPVERGVDLDRIEVLGVEPQLVEVARAVALRARGGIEQAVPRAFSRRIVPARRANQKRHGTLRGTGSAGAGAVAGGPVIDNKGIGHHQRDLLLGPGRVHLRRAAVRVRASDRVRPALLVVRYAVRLPRGPQARRRGCGGGGGAIRLLAGRGDGRRAAAAGRRVSADERAGGPRQDRAARDRWPSQHGARARSRLSPFSTSSAPAAAKPTEWIGRT